MIKLRNLITELLSERMSYSELMRVSDPKRIEKSSRIPAKSLLVQSINDKEAWKFSYKSLRNESTTGLRYQGFIYFFKDSISKDDNAMNIDCSVDCGCRDYRYRFSYANKQQDAGVNGNNSLNKGLNYPSSINRGPGLCKHLLSLKEFLKTKMEPEKLATIQPEPKSIKSPATKKTSIRDIPPEEPEDPTQVPVEPASVKPKEQPLEPVDDPTQTPDGPEQNDEPIKSSDEEPKKEKIKETFNKQDIQKFLDEFCKNNKTFVI